MRRIPLPGLVWIAFLPLLIIACSWYRYATGLHFQEVFVRLGEGHSQGTNKVYGVISPGRLVPLQRTAAVEKLWVFPFVQPVQCLFITTAEESAGSVTGFDGEVGVGQGWIDAERRVITKTQTVSSTDPEYGQSLQQLGLKGGLLVYPASISVSRFRSVGQAFNWGGDWSLLWVSTLQGILIWLSLSALHRGVTRIAADCHPAGLSVWKFGSWLCIPSQMLRLVLLVLLAHQFWVAVQSLFWVRSPAGFTTGVALFAILLCLYVGWLRWIWSSKSARGVVLRMVAAGMLVLVAKIYWLSTVEYRPGSDYLLFHRYGQQLAAGDWDGLATTRRFTLIFLCRAWFYSYPICSLLGSEITTFEYANMGIQAASVIVFCLLVARVSGLMTAAACMPLPLVYSEFWYSTGMVAPNVIAYFWIPLTWLLVDFFDRKLSGSADSQKMGIVKSLIFAGVLGATTGLCLGVVDMLKRYSPFFLIALALFMILRRWLSQTEAIPRFSARMLFLVVVVVTSQLFVQRVTTFLSTKSGMEQSNLDMTLAQVAFLETDSTALGRSFHQWMHSFFMNVPESRRLELQIRKILHEQIVGGANVYQHVLLKNRVMAHPTNAMTQVMDATSSAELGRSLMYAPHAASQITLGWHISLALILFGILRLLAIRACPLKSGEVFPLLSAVFTLAFAALFTEGHPYTGQNAAFPLCWSVGVMVQFLRKPETAGRTVSDSVFGSWELLAPGRLLVAAVLWAGLVVVHLGMGKVVESAGLTFHRISPVPPRSQQTDGLSEAEVGLIQSRVHAGIRLVPSDGQLKTGEYAERQFLVESLRPLRGVRFFITGNVRRFMPEGKSNFRAALAAEWKNLPIEYEVLLGEKLVIRGPLANLAQGKFVEYPADFWMPPAPANGKSPNSVSVTLKLRCTSDVDLRNVAWPPSLTVEFFH